MSGAALSPINEDSPLSSLDGPPTTEAAALRGLDVDLVIDIDVSGSMDWCLEPAKQLALEVLDKTGRLRAARSVRCGVVAYRDIRSRADLPASHVQILELTDNVEAVQEFIQGLKAGGGDDEAEDVAGALAEAFEFQWRVPVPSDNAVTRVSRAAGRFITRRQHSLEALARGQAGEARPDTNCRVVLHMWDAPPHGNAYHSASVGDSFGAPGAGPAFDPDNTLYLKMAEDFARNGIGYVSVRMPPYGSTELTTNEAWTAFRATYMRALPRMDPLDFTFSRETKASEIVRMMTRATEASIAAFSRSIGGRMVHRKGTAHASGSGSALAGGAAAGPADASRSSHGGSSSAAVGGAGAASHSAPTASSGGSPGPLAASSRRGTLNRTSHHGGGGGGDGGGGGVASGDPAASAPLSAAAAAAAPLPASLRRGTLNRSSAGTGAPAGAGGS